MIVLASVGLKTSRLYLEIKITKDSCFNLNFSDLHQRHPGCNGLPEMSLRDHQWPFHLPSFCHPLSWTKLEINAVNPPLTFSQRIWCWWSFKVFPRTWQHIKAQLKGPTYALVLPAHTASWPPMNTLLPICHPYEYLPLRRPRGWPDSVDLLRPIW